MTKVIAAVDDSAIAAAVLGCAHPLAELLGAQVEAVTVTDAHGETAAATAARAGVPFRAVPGDPLAVLVSLADEGDVIAFVVGQRSHPGTGPTGHLALGLAAAVLQPVLVVPAGAAVPSRFHRVLVAMAGVPGRGRQLGRALRLVSTEDLELIVLHVDDESSLPLFSDHAVYDTEAYAEEFLARFVPGTRAARLELRVGSPVEEVLRLCEAERPDAIAMGWPHDHAGVVPQRVLERSPAPVLLVATV